MISTPLRKPGKLGRKPGRSLPAGTLQLENYFTDYYTEDPLPAWNSNQPSDYTSGVEQWGILGNDDYGDCGFAARVHLEEANAWTGKEQPVGNISDTAVWPTYDQVVTAYFTYEGSPGGEPNPEYDNGVELSAVLQYWMTNPLSTLKPIGGYAQFDVTNGPLFQSCIHLFGGVYVGILVSSEAMDEFSNGQPWTSTATDWEGGHCVPILMRNTLYGRCITWGVQQEFSWPWWRVSREEGYVVFSEEMMNAPGGVWNGINVAKLKTDIQALSGTV